jgi:hypothetical protein
MALPLNLITVYADLVQQVHARAERHGSIYRQHIKGADYAYSRRTVGAVRRDVFLGREDDPAVRARIAAIRAESMLAKERRKLVAALRTAGMPVPPPELGAVLDVLDDAGLLGQVVLVGTAAFQCYPPVVGDTMPSASLITQDADIATISLSISADTQGDTLETILRRADPSFTGRLGLKPTDLPSSFRTESGYMVDLLTPVLRRDDPNPMPLPNLRAGATPLQHLKWLVENPVPIAVLLGTGIPAFVPQPARYAVHKLIIAQKRAVNPQKRQKDLAQAKALIDILKQRDRYALEDARDSAFAEGVEGWRVPIERSLAELKLNAEFEQV